MEFLKKHYEKILLGVVLLGLAGAVVFLYFRVESEKQQDDSQTSTLTHPKPVPLTPISTSEVEMALKRGTTPVSLELGTPHRLFNPLPWQKAGDHLEPYKSSSFGPMAVAVTKINELYLELDLDNFTPEEKDSPAQFLVSIRKDAAPLAKDRAKRQTRCKVGDKNDTFTVKSFKGGVDSSTNGFTNLVLLVELNDTGEPAELPLAKDKNFKRVDGYTADLKYPPDNKLWSNRRVGTSIQLGSNNEEYKIVAISPTEIVLSAKSNDKKWTIPVK